MSRTRPALGLAALIVAALPAAPAGAQILTIGTYGAWTAYGGATPQGSRVCGIEVRGDDREIHIKYFRGQPSFAVELFKRSWDIPQRVPVALSLQFGGYSTPSLRGVGYPRQDRLPAHVGVSITFEGSRAFWQALRGAATGRVVFESGNERPWTVSLSGSNAAVTAMSDCIRRMGAPTQPFDDGTRTRPFDTAPAASGSFTVPPGRPVQQGPGPQKFP
jgi:hypothetical protein